MSKEILTPIQPEAQSLSFSRSPDEVRARVEELTKQIKGHDVWIHTGNGKVPEPNSRRKRDIFEGKLRELKWALGEDFDVTDGVYW